MAGFSDLNHPLWRILEGAMYLGVLTFIMYGNAHNFDSNEINSIIQFMLVYSGLKTGKAFLEGRVGKGSKDSSGLKSSEGSKSSEG